MYLTRVLLLVLGVIFINGCALPTPLNILSTAHTVVDVGVYNETGKTSTEHLADEVTKKDCKWARAIDAALVCMDKEEEIDYAVEKIHEAVAKLRELSPLWDMYKDGVDLDQVQWAAH